MLKDIVEYDAMDIRMLDEDMRELVCIYSRDKNAEINEQFRLSIDEGMAGWVVRHDEAQLVNDMTHDPRGVHIPGTAEDVPQAQHRRPTARARAQSRACSHAGPVRRPRLRRARTLSPFKLFANLAAIAIQNARTYEEMERQAISDGLTGIHNYRHFHESLASRGQPRRALRQAHYCLLMMDLDHFKAVNDTIGHQKGRRCAARGLGRCCAAAPASPTTSPATAARSSR